MFKKSIKSRVWKAIRAKIQEAQKEHDLALESLKDDFADEVVTLRMRLEADEKALIEAHVNRILGKII